MDYNSTVLHPGEATDHSTSYHYRSTDPRSRRRHRGRPRLISERMLSDTVRLGDAVALIAVTILCSAAVRPVAVRNQDVLAGLISASIVLFCLGRGQSYTTAALRAIATQGRLILASLLLGLAGATGTIAFLRPVVPLPKTWLLAWVLFAAAALVASRCGVLRLLHVWDRAGRLTRRIAVVGSAEHAHRFVQRASDMRSAFQVVGVYHDGVGHLVDARAAAAGRPSDLLERCRREQIDGIVIALPLSEGERIAALRQQFAETVADVYLSTDLGAVGAGGARVVSLANEHAVLMHERPIKDWDALQKRIFDLTFAGLMAVALAPLMALIAVSIKLDSSGPVLFRQPRIGFNNVPLSVLKFRTMFDHCADLLGDQQTTRRDRRVTRVGKWLRALSLDELPQLYNVLEGQMSLVGPRPHAPNTKAEGRLFPDVVSEYARRHRVKPGITGWAQVNGWRGETRTLEQIENRVACDLYYIDNWSLLLDARIMMLTVMRGFSGPQAY